MKNFLQFFFSRHLFWGQSQFSAFFCPTDFCSFIYVKAKFLQFFTFTFLRWFFSFLFNFVNLFLVLRITKYFSYNCLLGCVLISINKTEVLCRWRAMMFEIYLLSTIQRPTRRYVYCGVVSVFFLPNSERIFDMFFKVSFTLRFFTSKATFFPFFYYFTD